MQQILRSSLPRILYEMFYYNLSLADIVIIFLKTVTKAVNILPSQAFSETACLSSCFSREQLPTSVLVKAIVYSRWSSALSFPKAIPRIVSLDSYLLSQLSSDSLRYLWTRPRKLVSVSPPELRCSRPPDEEIWLVIHWLVLV